ncbi:MAG: hypothetical protein DRG24_06630 [Epsilonproteobacteria bacterium]|nr:MAG: hypothetical protein DRG24_06630 [Campylobacterota bacterium]
MKTRRSNFDLLVSIFTALALLSLFIFMLLVPEGKAYRIVANDVEKKDFELSRLQMQYDQYFDRHSHLQDEYRDAMQAIENDFNIEDFIEKHSPDVNSLEAQVLKSHRSKGVYSIKDVNITARFNSPNNFYILIEKMNQSEWVMAIKRPIIFERIEDEIQVTFSMKVYSAAL